MPKGIIWVSSRIVRPNKTRPGVPLLSPDRFCTWYEETHIQEVTALEGVPSAVRWEGTRPQPQHSWSNAAPWLTVYEMPDIEYRNSAEFKGLDGQSAPKDELLHEIFEQARFDTRFYEEVSSTNSDAAPEKYLVSWAGDDVDVKALEGIEGVGRVRGFRVVAGTTLEGFVRRDALGEGGVRVGLVLAEFEEGGLEAVKEVVGRRGGDEVGWFERKRGYGV